MPPALPASVAMNLVPDSLAAWDIAEPPTSAPAAIPRVGKIALVRVANGLAVAAGPVSGFTAVAIGDDLTTGLLQGGVATFLAFMLLRGFAHVAARVISGR